MIKIVLFQPIASTSLLGARVHKLSVEEGEEEKKRKGSDLCVDGRGAKVEGRISML